MANSFDSIDDALTEFVVSQPVFFVATAPLGADGRINCSPKGNRGEFAVIGPTTVAYLDQTGSGSETIAHLRENGRIVIMFCAFSGPPRIVRFQGTGSCIALDHDGFAELAAHFPAADGVGVRSIIKVEVGRIADSCGYGVPFMDFQAHRPAMDAWATRKGPDGIRDYWDEENRVSIDGLPALDLDRVE